MNVGAAYVQTVGVGEVFLDSVLGDLVSGLAELVCLLDYLVVDIGEVLNIENFVSIFCLIDLTNSSNSNT